MDWAILAEELCGAYTALGCMVGITSAGTQKISKSENVTLRDRILQGLLAGHKIICTGITEPNVGSNAGGIETRVVLDGDYYVINGTKPGISNGSIADYCVIVALLELSRGHEVLAAVKKAPKMAVLSRRVRSTKGSAHMCQTWRASIEKIWGPNGVNKCVNGWYFLRQDKAPIYFI